MEKITKQEWVRLQSLIEPKLFKQLKAYSYHKNISLCEISRRALRMFLDEENKLRKEVEEARGQSV